MDKETLARIQRNISLYETILYDLSKWGMTGSSLIKIQTGSDGFVLPHTVPSEVAVELLPYIRQIVETHLQICRNVRLILQESDRPSTTEEQANMDPVIKDLEYWAGRWRNCLYMNLTYPPELYSLKHQSAVKGWWIFKTTYHFDIAVCARCGERIGDGHTCADVRAYMLGVQNG